MPRGLEARLSVHFAAVAGRQVEQVVGPLRDTRADHLFLLREGADDEHQASRELVVERLRGSTTKVDEIDVEFEDPPMVAHVVGRTIDELGYHEYWFNLSTGPREAALAGVWAGMFWDVTPYLSRLDREKPFESSETDLYPYKNATEVPLLRPPRPDKPVLDCLALIASGRDGFLQRKLIQALERLGHIAPRNGRAGTLTPQAKHAQFSIVATGLERAGLAEKLGTGRGCKWFATEQGRMVDQILNGASGRATVG